MLTLLGRDGNNQNFPVAAALVPTESSANVRWFVDHCLKSHVPLCNGRPIFLRPRCDSECRGGLARGSRPRNELPLLHISRYAYHHGVWQRYKNARRSHVENSRC
ncbi:TPA: hypothetical protein N0F65_011205 [Lagenidium giganteum]|uniref:Uncharacterized protein n=1 Tax=Lagenidium giganteum TaxID=4803 RepID=A0AAV2Z5B2_9STRA|nr:TPA: hypothetical protein N0F65_011205 [Lagenidium giganteum]